MNRQKAAGKGIGRRHRQKAKKWAGQGNRQGKETGRARQGKGKATGEARK